jgi:hypothetical protein
MKMILSPVVSFETRPKVCRKCEKSKKLKEFNSTLQNSSTCGMHTSVDSTDSVHRRDDALTAGHS